MCEGREVVVYYLGVVVLIGEQLRDSNVLLAKCPDGGQPLECHGDVRIERTSSYNIIWVSRELIRVTTESKKKAVIL